jgi:hypothetical protein
MTRLNGHKMAWAYWIIGILVVLILVGVGLVIYAVYKDKREEETAHLQATLDWNTDNNANWGQMNRDAEAKVDKVVDDASRHILDIK